MRRAIGLSVHTGWAACVIAGGTVAAPVIDTRERIELLCDADRFVYHRAAELPLAEAQRAIEAARRDALAAARRALARLITPDVVACAIVARLGDPGELEAVLAAHPKIHTAEGCFYRDVLLAASTVPARVIPPAALDVGTKAVAAAGATVGRPWGRDQKLAALAAWHVLCG